MITIVAEDNTALQNTALLGAGQTAGAMQNPALLGPPQRYSARRGSTFPAQSRFNQMAPRWIAPVVPQVLPHDGQTTRHSGQFLRVIPLPSSIRPAYSVKEIIFLGLLSAAAVLAIGYACFCGIGLAGNWEMFQAGIEKLIQG
jgi:hypothetical protein